MKQFARERLRLILLIYSKQIDTLMDVIFQNTKQTSVTSVDREGQYYLIYSEGHVNVDDFKGGFNAILEDVKQSSKISTVIIDIKKVKSTPLLGRTWLVTSYLPELYKSIEGKLQIGVINSDSFIEGTTIKLLVTSIQTMGLDLGIKFYKNAEEAKKALTETKA